MVFLSKVQSYLQHKNLGGYINQRGNMYEEFFATFCIAELLLDYVDNKKVSIISGQISGFVDDLHIYCNQENRFYQLKTSKVLNWSSGFKSLNFDFRAHIFFYSPKTDPLRLFLVVSDKDLSFHLTKTTPRRIKSYTTVTYFPFCKSLSLLIRTNLRFKELLESLSSFKNPGTDKLEPLATSLLGIWSGANKTSLTIQDVYNQLMLFEFSFLKLPYLTDISLELASILNKIAHFEYKIEQGYLSYCYNKNDNGFIPYPLDSEKFRNIEQKILKRNPESFSDLEELI